MLFTDQMNRLIRLESTPKRIISLVPSQTELLYDLGLDERVVGITKFCIHPESWFKSKTRVGGTKKLNLHVIDSLEPDLIIGNKEENTQEEIELLSLNYPVWMSDIYNLEDSIEMILHIGEMCNISEKSIVLSTKIKTEFEHLKLSLKNKKKENVLYLIWKNPYYAVASNTFIDDMLQKCGFTNFLKEESRYPIWDPFNSSQPDHIFLSSEPYPFKETDILELKTLFPNSQIQLVDGEIFSWYGSRIIQAPTYFLNEIIKK